MTSTARLTAATFDENLMTYVPRGRADVMLQQKNRQRTKDLEKALVRAVTHHGHHYTCSAARGMERDCTCGWLKIREMVKAIDPDALRR